MRSLGKTFPDCTVCHRPGYEKQRESWGCDAPAPSPVFAVGCSVCAGQLPDCEECNGTGEVQVHRCPTALLKEDDEAAARVVTLMRAYIQYDTRHTLPCSGAGFMEHPVSFCAGVEIVDHERGRWDRMRDEARERDRKAAEIRSRQAQAQARGGSRHRALPPKPGRGR